MDTISKVLNFKEINQSGKTDCGRACLNIVGVDVSNIGKDSLEKEFIRLEIKKRLNDDNIKWESENLQSIIISAIENGFPLIAHIATSSHLDQSTPFHYVVINGFSLSSSRFVIYSIDPLKDRNWNLTKITLHTDNEFIEKIDSLIQVNISNNIELQTIQDFNIEFNNFNAIEDELIKFVKPYNSEQKLYGKIEENPTPPQLKAKKSKSLNMQELLKINQNYFLHIPSDSNKSNSDFIFAYRGKFENKIFIPLLELRGSNVFVNNLIGLWKRAKDNGLVFGIELQENGSEIYIMRDRVSKEINKFHFNGSQMAPLIDQVSILKKGGLELSKSMKETIKYRY